MYSVFKKIQPYTPKLILVILCPFSPPSFRLYQCHYLPILMKSLLSFLSFCHSVNGFRILGRIKNMYTVKRLNTIYTYSIRINGVKYSCYCTCFENKRVSLSHKRVFFRSVKTDACKVQILETLTFTVRNLESPIFLKVPNPEMLY